MKKLSCASVTSTALLLAPILATGMAYGQSSPFDALANLPFEQNRPTLETAKKFDG
jgi:hypothetical protein